MSLFFSRYGDTGWFSVAIVFFQWICGDHFASSGSVVGCLIVSHGVSPVLLCVLVPSCSRGHQTPVSNSVLVHLYGTLLGI